VPIQALYDALSELASAEEEEAKEAKERIFKEFEDIIGVAGAGKQYKCTVCDATLKTASEAMGRHARYHRCGPPIKIHQARGSGVLRPEEHIYNHSTHKWYGGSDTNLYQVTGVEPFLKGSEVIPGQKCLHCPYCKKFTRPYDAERSLKAHHGMNVFHLIEHIKSCAGARAAKEETEHR